MAFVLREDSKVGQHQNYAGPPDCACNPCKP